jgi:predicted nucleic acid-binding protein
LIFLDTNVIYNLLFETKFSPAARRFIEHHNELATSSNVINELISVSVRNLCEERYNTRNYSSFRRFVVQNGYDPFKKDLDAIFQFLENSDLCILPIDEDANHWREIMQKYRLLPCDSLIVSTCISNGVKHIATFDRDFLRVDQLNVIDLNK